MKKDISRNTNKKSIDLSSGISSKDEKKKNRKSKVEKILDKAENALSKIEEKKVAAERLLSSMEKEEENIKKTILKIKEEKQNAGKESSKILKKIKTINEVLLKIQKKDEKSDSVLNEIKEKGSQAKIQVEEMKKQKECFESLSDQINKQNDNDQKLMREKREEIESLKRRIEHLLPGATSAGLASSYLKGYETKKTRLYWIGFVISLLGLFLLYLWTVVQSQDIVLAKMLLRLIIGMPLIWFAWFCQKSISQTNRIKEEYHHKQRIMTVFYGFSKQIESLSKDDPKNGRTKKLEFISNIIRAISKNPSEILSSSETFLDFLKKERIKKKNQKDEK